MPDFLITKKSPGATGGFFVVQNDYNLTQAQFLILLELAMSLQLSKIESSAEQKQELWSTRFLGAVGRTMLTGSAHFLAFTLVLFVLCGPVLVFADMYVEKGSKIPVLTVLIVHHARWMSYYGWFLLYLPAVLLNAMFLFALNMLPAKWRWIPRCYSSFVLLAALLYVSIAFSAMSVPQQFASEQLETEK